MTVSPVLFYALIWAFLLSAFFALFWVSKLIERTNEVDKLRRVIESNQNYYHKIIRMVYDKICDSADLRYIDLPKISTDIYQRVQNVFLDNPELNPYEFPIVKETLTGLAAIAVEEMGNNDSTLPVYYWRLNQEEMPPTVLAHLWLNGVI